MAVNEWRGDAPAVAQETLLVPPLAPNRVDFWMGNPTNGYRALGYDAIWDGTSPSTAAIVTRWSGSNLPEFQEVIATPTQYNRDNGDTVTALLLKSKTPGVPFSVVATLAGSEFTNEVQLVNLLYSPTGGTWALSFNGQTTTGLAITATAAQVQTALEALSNIAPGDVTVTGGNGAFRVQFGGAYASTDVPRLAPVYINTLTGGNLSIAVSTLVEGVPAVDEVQRVNIIGNPTGGTFTLGLPGLTAATLDFDATASEVAAGLNGVLGSGEVTATGGPLPNTPVVVTFSGTEYGDRNLDLLTGDPANLTGGDAIITVATPTPGVAGTNAKIRFRLAADPEVADVFGRTGFAYKFILATGSYSWHSVPLTYTSTAAQIQNALENMLFQNLDPGAPAFCGAGNVVVTGSLDDSWLSTSNYLEIEFVGLWKSCPINLSTANVPNVLPNGTVNGTIVNNSLSQLLRTNVSLGVFGTNEVQTLTQTGSGVGKWRLKFGTELSELLDYGVTAATIQAALVKLPSLGTMGPLTTVPGAVTVAPVPNPLGSSSRSNVVCTGGPLGTAPVTLTFSGAGVQSTNVATIEAIEGAAGGAIAVESVTEGFEGVPEVQRVRILKPWPAVPDPRSGTWSLTYSGQTASALAAAATAGDLQTALEGLSNLSPGDVFVSGASLVAGFNVTFRAGLGNVDLMSGDASGLNNGVVSVETDVDGGQLILQLTRKRSRGPWHGDDPLNWSLGHVLESGEQALFQFGSTGPRYGIAWLSTWTVSPADNTRLMCRNDLVDGQKVRVDSSGTLPTGLAAGTDYYVIRNRADSIQLATTRGGTPIELSGGSGTHRVYVRCAGIKSRSTWSGWAGSLRTNENRYVEYRPLYWSLGFVDGARVTLGEGSGGSGSPLFRLNSHDFPVSLEVLATQGSKETTLPAVLWLGENAANAVELIDGELGIGVLRDETAELASLVVRSGECQLGGAVTVDSVDVTGGNLKTLSAPAVKLWIRGA
jgi:hypothetical protein